MPYELNPEQENLLALELEAKNVTGIDVYGSLDDAQKGEIATVTGITITDLNSVMESYFDVRAEDSEAPPETPPEAAYTDLTMTPKQAAKALGYNQQQLEDSGITYHTGEGDEKFYRTADIVNYIKNESELAAVLADKLIERVGGDVTIFADTAKFVDRRLNTITEKFMRDNQATVKKGLQEHLGKALGETIRQMGVSTLIASKVEEKVKDAILSLGIPGNVKTTTTEEINKKVSEVVLKALKEENIPELVRNFNGVENGLRDYVTENVRRVVPAAIEAFYVHGVVSDALEQVWPEEQRAGDMKDEARAAVANYIGSEILPALRKETTETLKKLTQDMEFGDMITEAITKSPVIEGIEESFKAQLKDVDDTFKAQLLELREEVQRYKDGLDQTFTAGVDLLQKETASGVENITNAQLASRTPSPRPVRPAPGSGAPTQPDPPQSG
jgi:hypothetical protein